MISVAQLTPEHFDLVAAWLSDDRINQWLTSEWRGQAVSSRLLPTILRNRRNRLLLVCLDGQPQGLVGFSDLDEVDGVAMIWYLLGNRDQGSRGLISGAVASALHMAFGEFGLSCVYAWIIDGNEPSRRVLAKNGFREVGRIRSAARYGGRIVDRVYFDLTAADFACVSTSPSEPTISG